MKAITTLTLLTVASTIVVLSACSEKGGVTSPGPEQREAFMRDYSLVINDSEREVRTKDAGDGLVPWAQGMMGRRFESTVLSVKEGFTFPQTFIDNWQDELSANLVSYWQVSEETYADFGWSWYASQGDAKEVECIKFKQPLPFWPSQGDRIETTVSAYVMKLNTTSLFDPRGSGKGKPELEGDLTATVLCEHIVRGSRTIQFDYTLSITGQGVMRFFNPTGEEWLESGGGHIVDQDREEPCSIEITRSGMKGFTRDIGGTWYLSEDVFNETWHAESQESDMTVQESSLGGPGETYSLMLADLPKREPAARTVMNVYDFGAKGDGSTLDTSAINEAIEACNGAGGGIVYFPPGIFLSASIHMKSEVTLKLAQGALIRGTTDMTKYDPREENPWSRYQDISQSYFHRSLIWGEGLENVGFIGPGMIDGNDAFEAWPGMTTSPPPPFGWLLSTILYQINDELFQRGPKPIALKRCSNVLIKDVTITHAPDESIIIAGCDSVLVDGYRAQEVRVDGIDPVCSRKVTIARSEIKSLDDSVAIKSSYTLGARIPCEDITVKDSLLSTFINALKIGTESVGDFRNIVYEDCIISNAPGFPSFAGLSMISVDGGTIEGLAASNITMRNVNYPVFIRVGDRLRSPEKPSVGNIRSITIRNVTATGGIGTGSSSITAVPGYDVEGPIQMYDVDIVCKGGGHLLSSYLPYPEIKESDGVYPDPPYILPGRPPAYGFFCRHAQGLEFHNLHFGFDTPDHRAALIFDDVDGLTLDGIEAQRAPQSAPSIIVR